MNREQAEMVREFYLQFKQPVNSTLTVNQSIVNYRIGLLMDEIGELCMAKTLVQTLDALVDIEYVNLGTAVALGIVESVNDNRVYRQRQWKHPSGEKPSTLSEAGTRDLWVDALNGAVTIQYAVDSFLSGELTRQATELLLTNRVLELEVQVQKCLAETNLLAAYNAAFLVVHNSNLTKRDADGRPAVLPNGTIVKGELYVSPAVGLANLINNL